MKKSGDLLGKLDSAHLHGQLVVALLDVVARETPNADAKAFLLAHGLEGGDKLSKKASAALAGRMSEEKVLLRLGIGSKVAAGAPKANADLDGEGRRRRGGQAARRDDGGDQGQGRQVVRHRAPIAARLCRAEPDPDQEG